jgi:hypothetical protein
MSESLQKHAALPITEFVDALRFWWKLDWICFGGPAGDRGATVIRNISRVSPITGVETNKDNQHIPRS